MRIAALSRLAQRAGLTPGLSLADARARIPDLWVEEMDSPADAALLDAMADDCDRVTPIVMVDAPDGLLLDITGCGHLFGGEAALRFAVSNRLRRAGLHVRTVIASAADAARALARHGDIAIVPPGGEAAAVRPLPVAALGLSEKNRLAIARAGLKTIGSMADRPSMLFSSRFGEETTLRLRRLQGLAPAPLTPRRAAPMLWAERRFAEPIGRVEDIEAALSDLAYEICARLFDRREGGRVFETAFHRADGAVRRVPIAIGRPLRDPAVVLRLFHERLDTLADPIDPGFGFDLMRLSLPLAEPLTTIQSGLDGHAVEDNAIADLTDRLSVRFGADRVLRFALEDTHDPARAARVVPAGAGQASGFWCTPGAGEPPLRPVHMFDPPQLVTVDMAEIPDGPPRRFTWRRKHHDITRAEGPERISAEWWRAPDDPARDYYRVEDADGRRFWLFRMGDYTDNARWYVHGVFP